MYKDKFVLSIIHDGSPVKETGHKYNREVAIPFDSEYQIRLKNKNDRSCTARVFIDGKRASQLGDVIIHAGGTVDLERYVDRSLTEGKKFKFVSLDHSDVDDPTSSENGIIKVEFRLAKSPDEIKILPNVQWNFTFDNYGYKYKEDNNGPQWIYTNSITSDGNFVDNIAYCCSSNEIRCSDSPKVAPGATIEGGKSTQSFMYSDLEVEDNAVVLKLKLVGIKDIKMMDRTYKYCSNCGFKVKRVDKYCSECGHKL
jgi:hypothetical protein